MRSLCRLAAGYVVAMLLPAAVLDARAAPPTDDEVRAALDRACTFFHDRCAKHGGYVWRYSRDLSLSEGEAETGPDTVWVQPPATPSVGIAYLQAAEATGDAKYRDWAAETARTLVRGQLQTGGWYYGIELDPEVRKRWAYRDNPEFRFSKTKKNDTARTTLDDDTTPAALRCLMGVDRALDLKDAAIHEAALFALDALVLAQMPNGGWVQNWDRPPQPRSTDEFPILKATYPASWSRDWDNAWTGRYYTNDGNAANMLRTMWGAHEAYRDERYRAAAVKTGEFLLAAQMPEPQPGWAQQYDAKMQPVWDRKFEPPAVSGRESQDMLEALLFLAEKTGDRRFLEPFPRALAWLERSQLADGRLARFYELQTNKPLYFRVVDEKYLLTYDPDKLPTHYGFIVDSRVADLRREYDRVQSGIAPGAFTPTASADDEVAAIIAALDDRGAWIDPRGMKGFKKASPEGVIQSQTFVDNVAKLCAFLKRP